MTTRTNTKPAAGVSAKTAVKAGALYPNHNLSAGAGLRAKSAVKAGSLVYNHNASAVR